MGRINRILFLLIFILFVSIQPFAEANSLKLDKLERNEAITLVKNASTAQYDLVEGEYTRGEIEDKLTPYFTDDFIGAYIEWNFFNEEDKYRYKATDNPISFIPSFSYKEETMIRFDKKNKQYLVYEYFPKVEFGPVLHSGRFEIVKLINVRDVGVKISSIVYSKKKP